MLIIGLTGGIGSGKSTVAHHFETLGIPVIDADVITRDLVAPGQPALQEIIQQFGSEFILPNGELDRARLRQRVFDNTEARKNLETILHPRAHTEAQRLIAACQSATPQAPYVILSAPLLIESGWTDLVQRVLVVDSSRENQVQRTRQRDGLSVEQINHIIDSQTDRHTRLAAANDVINNNGNLDALIQQVDTLHQKYRQLAKNRD
jgi:dephospho-CoA kinase